MELRMAVDVKDGQYVYATGGDRRLYRPPAWMEGRALAPQEAMAALGQRFGVDRFYVADLDAIAGDRQAAVARYRGVASDMWLDLGVRSSEDWQGMVRTFTCPLIMATETASFHDWPQLLRLLRYDDVVSLDMRGDLVLFRDTAVPLAVIQEYLSLIHDNLRILVLDLDRVGSGRGPNWAVLQRLEGQHPRLWIGGGIRHGGDLEEAERMGIEGAVVATAIFTGAIAWPFRRPFPVADEG
ncbi:MAG: HisA/HisF-related TIM barrel protein [Firmicutes bacterium]|nr:HisA/HisF-related TIM barrel protein [Bacillota bacterium]